MLVWAVPCGKLAKPEGGWVGCWDANLGHIDSGSQKVQHNLDVISHKIEAILKTRIDVSTNSTDLEWAPGARSIGDEFVKTSILLIKL